MRGMKELKYGLRHYFESVPHAVKVRILRVPLRSPSIVCQASSDAKTTRFVTKQSHRSHLTMTEIRTMTLEPCPDTEDVTDSFTQRRHYSVIPNKDALHPTRPYGYTIKLSPPIVDRQDHMDVEGIGYWPITPPRIRVLRYQGWYKYRYLAQRRCDDLNHCKESPHIRTPVVDPNTD